MNKMVVVIPSYNNSKWYLKNLDSVFSQNYSQYRVIYTDDVSSDKTGALVQQYISDRKLAPDKVTFIQNEARCGAMRNLYDMIHSCDDDEIIVTLDGDDMLAHPGALSRVNKEYESGEVWMTWGSYVDLPKRTPGCARPIPKHVIDTNSFRRHPWCFSHLRTFRANIFKKLPASDFQDNNGKWMMAGWDLPIMFGLAELSGHRIRHIPDTLYLYNNENPIQDYKVRLGEQQAIERLVRGRAPHKRL